MNRFIAACVCLLSMACPAHASLVFGLLTDSNGVAVEGADIQVFDQSGGEVAFFNDATDVTGNFLFDVPDGLYDIVFLPPPPPGDDALLPGWRNDINVSGTTDLGTTLLVPGFAVYGRILDNSGFPVIGVNIDVENSVNSDELFLANDSTDTDGSFGVVVTSGTWDLLFDTSTSSHPLTVPLALFSQTISADLNLGDLVAAPGFVLSATLQDVGGVPVQNADINVRLSSSGEKLYTPGDDSNGLGFVDVVLGAGTYDIEVRPLQSTRLQGKRLTQVTVSGTTNLGAISLGAGVQISGRVSNPMGQGEDNVAFELIDGAGQEIYVAWSQTNELGDYLVIVPSGTWEIRFTPRLETNLGRAVFDNVVVGGDQVLNASLPACLPPSHYGTPTSGSGGFVPRLEPVGLARIGNADFVLSISDALGSSTGFLLIALGPADLPGNGWRLLVNPSLGFTVIGVPILGPPVPGAGFLNLPAALPYIPILGGVSLYMQAIILDGGALTGIATSDGLQLPICP